MKTFFSEDATLGVAKCVLSIDMITPKAFNTQTYDKYEAKNFL